MFYVSTIGKNAIQQDHTLEVAVRIADPSINFNPKYFQTRAWEKSMGQSLNARLYGDETLKRVFHSSQASVDIRNTSGDSRGTVDFPVSVPQMEHSQRAGRDDGDQHVKRSTTTWQSLQRDRTEPPFYPTKVLLECYNCKENTERSGRESLYLDENARWTIGLTRALYVFPRRCCSRCETRYSVPKDSTINSITKESLRKFWVKNQRLEPSMQATLLDSYNFQRRGPRNLVLYGEDEGSEVEISQPDGSALAKGLPRQSGLDSRDSNTTLFDSTNPKMKPFSSSSTSPRKQKKSKTKTRNIESVDAIERFKRDPADCNGLPLEVEAWCPVCKEDTVVPPSSSYYLHGR